MNQLEEFIRQSKIKSARPIRGFLYRRVLFGHNAEWTLKHPLKTLKGELSRRRNIIKNERDRAKNIFGFADRWDFFSSNAEAQIRVLTWFKEKGMSFPGQFVDNGGVEAWHDKLDIMIDGFQAALDVDQAELSDGWDAYLVERTKCEERLAVGMAVYAEFYLNLWD